MFEKLSCHGVIAAALIAPPCGELITALAGIDASQVSESAQLDLLVAWERQTAWVTSCQQPVLTAVGVTALAYAGGETDDSGGWARTEIGAALRLSDFTAYQRLEVGQALCSRLAPVQQLLAAGDICYWHATAVYQATDQLTDEQAALVLARVLGRASKQSVSELRAALRRAVLAADPKPAADRAKKAHKTERGVRWWPLEDGLAELRLISSAADILSVYQAADTLARQHPGAVDADGDPIGIDSRRADALVALATGTATATGTGTARPPAAVNVTIDLPTLRGLQDNPAELAGYGPIPAPIARTLAADGIWRRLIYEPQTGALLDLGHTSYQPSAALARYI